MARGRRRPGRRYQWVRSLINEAAQGAAVTNSYGLVVPADFIGDSGQTKQYGTLKRIRGMVAISPTAAVFSSYCIGIVLRDEDETVPAVHTEIVLNDEDWLWHVTGHWAAAAADFPARVQYFNIDVASARKMGSDSTISFINRSIEVGATYNLDASISCLLDMGSK